MYVVPGTTFCAIRNFLNSPAPAVPATKFLFDVIVMWTLSSPFVPLSDATPLPLMVHCIVFGSGSAVFPSLSSKDDTVRNPDESAVPVPRFQPFVGSVGRVPVDSILNFHVPVISVWSNTGVTTEKGGSL